MRNLASVVTVDRVWPLEGKDRVQGASFKENAYEAMVGKDMQPGELVAFIQEGSILPETEQWEFLRKRCYKEGIGFVIKVQKFKDIKSWGLALKLNELGLEEKEYSKFKAGDDITDILNIKKYEPEEDASPKPSKKAYPKFIKFCLKHGSIRWIGRIWQNAHSNEKGGFPTDLISKSDETTIQNYQEAITKFANERVYTSLKMEGQSVTAVLPLNKKGKIGKFYVCSRNNAYRNPCNNDFWNAAKRLDVEKKLIHYYKKTGEALIIQAEQCGPGIQKNIYHLDELEWFVYTIKKQTKDGKCIQLPFNEMVDACISLDLKTVPMIETAILKDIMPTINDAVAYAEKRYWVHDSKRAMINHNNDDINININHNDYYYKPTKKEQLWKDYAQHEGVVVRSLDYDKDRNIGVSFKVKNIDYAEKGVDKIAAMKWD